MLIEQETEKTPTLMIRVGNTVKKLKQYLFNTNRKMNRKALNYERKSISIEENVIYHTIDIK